MLSFQGGRQCGGDLNTEKTDSMAWAHNHSRKVLGDQIKVYVIPSLRHGKPFQSSKNVTFLDQPFGFKGAEGSLTRTHCRKSQEPVAS